MTQKEVEIYAQIADIGHEIGKLKGENKILREENEKLWKLLNKNG